MKIVDTIIELFADKGNEAYLGEPVSQLEHALQTAYLADQEGASDILVAAALLHDIGHLLHGLPEHVADQGVDGHHEAVGDAWLSQFADEEVTEPMKLHVAAKRYLCASDPDYLNGLSPASVKSLELQGGPFSETEMRAFQENPFYEDALRLRRWDDHAKIEGLAVPDLESYRVRLNRVFGV
ncbi:MAG: HD domain-containing protein [Candidatus Latescibacteria bacterium]|jgi:[1-hydroxy-2-(trimethylamino)ethyl]phosphonate dioxygenase|nr:HD domain-containing protein [Candidatus Latescibacterota bacterium]